MVEGNESRQMVTARKLHCNRSQAPRRFRPLANEEINTVLASWFLDVQDRHQGTPGQAVAYDVVENLLGNLTRYRELHP
jgi:hypothetical protein